MQIIHAARAIAAILLILLSIGATPLHAQNFACAAGSTATDTSASAFLGKLGAGVGKAWPSHSTRTRNLRAVQSLLGHTKLESTVKYLGIEVDDALEIAEQTEA
jgi:hypothetical protein